MTSLPEDIRQFAVHEARHIASGRAELGGNIHEYDVENILATADKLAAYVTNGTVPTTPPVNLNPVPVGDITSDGKKWVQTLAQDFNTPAALGEFATKYKGYAGYDGAEDTSRNLGRPVGKRGLYDSKTGVTVKDSVVDIYVRTEAGQPKVFAMTPVVPDGTYGQLYGRFAVRFKADTVPGFKMAWLLWPNSENWADGEIDFPEGPLGGEIKGYSHNVTGTPDKNAWDVSTGKNMSEWHTAIIEWSPGKLRFILDDVAKEFTAPVGLPKVPMHWVLQTETELTATAPPVESKGHVYIDWIAMYKLG